MECFGLEAITVPCVKHLGPHWKKVLPPLGRSVARHVCKVTVPAGYVSNPQLFIAMVGFAAILVGNAWVPVW
jgi:hypothetical protein